MSSTQKAYDVFAYKQSLHSEAPTLLSLVVPAEELLEWAGIPRRADDRLVGFQRPDDPQRVAAAKEFFNTGPNQSPTSLIVGIHEGASQIEVSLEGSDGDKVRKGVLTVTLDADEVAFDVVINRVRDQLEGRLAKSTSETDDQIEAEDSDGESEEDDETDDDESTDEDREVGIGKSIIKDLLIMLDDVEWTQANEEHLRAMAKPATVIDGQHRLLGAAECERKIPFQICAIQECAWEEQVFQFTIVNYKQKGIPDQFITANAALSLTRGELDELQDRLVQAKVKVVEYELMKTVEFDPLSPFYKLVNLTEKSASNLIGYKTMVRIANGWYQANAPFFQLLLPALYPDITGKSSKSRRKERWKDEDWGQFFLDYWTLVKNSYGAERSHVKGQTLWDVGDSQLMVAIVLFEFQNVFFESLSDQDEEFFEIESDNRLDSLRSKLQKRATKLFESFPPELFQESWKEKSLNTGAGRSALQAVFTEMKKHKGNWNWKNSTLVKGQ
jgi:hypothetical protein